MRTLPIELLVEGKEALVVGRGDEIEKKARALDAAGAIVVRKDEDARMEDAEGKAIVFVAPDHPLAKAFFDRASEASTLVCTVDRPELSTCAGSAVVRAGGLTMTFASGGASPGLVKRVREDLEALFSTERFAEFVAELARVRRELPRGARAKKMSELVKGFAIEARLRYPEWFDAKSR